MLRPLDIVILLKIHCKGDQPWSQMSLAKELHISSRSVNEGLKRASLARLYDPLEKKVWSLALAEAVTRAVRFYIPAELGSSQTGMPTAWAARPLNQRISSDDSDRPVWPLPGGEGFGPSLIPLHDSVPLAAQRDAELYELLALIDAMRAGRARERGLAAKEFEKRLGA